MFLSSSMFHDGDLRYHGTQQPSIPASSPMQVMDG
uniref:Uncharacterized protein n=1 Tax=Setaria italica TaxID=4555 RepID=K3ZGI6_SETIT